MIQEERNVQTMEECERLHWVERNENEMIIHSTKGSKENKQQPLILQECTDFACKCEERN